MSPAFLLRTIRVFFEAVERGSAYLRGFDPEWARPTFRLVRMGVVVLFLVMIFPYIPGSSTDAFKGISLFLGVIVSLGSSSFISNIIAGYTMTYRRAFRVGDRIRIGDEIGDVEETRLMVTHLRTPKNEEVIVPNTLILGGNVTNYSSLARKEGLILDVDFGARTWSASFNDQAFRRSLAPLWGKIRANILVGGLPWVNREDAVLDYTADLRFQRHVQQRRSRMHIAADVGQPT